MLNLPARPDLDQLRHQAKDLLHAAHRGDPGAIARVRAVSDQITLSAAQLALAREYGFASWAKLKLEAERRDTLNGRDLSRLTKLLAEHPELATTKMEHWADRQRGEPLDYITMLRFNHDRLGLPRELPGTGAIAKALIDSGAPVNGRPGDKETPLITAASYGDAEVAKVLIDAGADIDAVSSRPGPQSTRPTPSGGGCPCTPRRATAGPPASSGCLPTGPTPTSATPSTIAHRWRNVSQQTTWHTARSRLSSGP
jgi:uncharacterized protein